MSEKRFTWKTEKLQHLDDEVIMVVDNENKDWKGHILNIVDLLNEQQATIKELKEEIKLLKPTNIEQYEQIQKLQKENRELRKELGDCEKFRYSVFKRMEELQAQLREKEQDEQLYANEIVKLNKEAKEVLDFKSLGGDY